jgi:GH24 family phage-related lysozyme (muramidase)
LIKHFEGWYPNFYTDPVGIRTIGYGHACHVWDCSVPLNGKYPVPLSLANGNSLLADDLAAPGRYEACIRNEITYSNLNANQFSALASFAFNLGCGSVGSSTLKQLLNGGNTLAASLEFAKWINAGGQPLLGLARRREAERVLFCQSGGCETPCAGTVNADTLNIRKDPNSSSFIVGTLTNGQRVDIYSRVAGTVISGNPYWFRVGPGYVSAYYINIVSSGVAWCAKS